MLSSLRQYVSITSQVSEQIVFLGRHNLQRADIQGDRIIVDYQSAEPLGKELVFDGDKEMETESTVLRKPCTISFLGDNAEAMLENFLCSQSSQLARDTAHAQGLSVMHPSNILNVGDLWGTQQGRRIDVTVNVLYRAVVTRPCAAIESAPLTFLTDPKET